MRVLLDANVWIYLADHSSARELASAMSVKTKVLVAPSVVYEALRVKSQETLQRRADLLTHPDWKRLMPEAYSESMELLPEIKRARPWWLRFGASRGFVQRLRHDWGRTKTGFWSRVRNAPDVEAARIRYMGDNLLDAARAQSRRQRDDQIGRDWNLNAPLNSLQARLPADVPGYDGDAVEPWRVNALTTMSYAFRDRRHPYVEWLEADIRPEIMLSDRSDWNRFWLYDISENATPRLWLRWSFEYLQMFHKVTDGTPGDNQLGTYLIDADCILSADRNFVRMVNIVGKHANFPMAQGKLVPAGREGVEETLTIIKNLG